MRAVVTGGAGFLGSHLCDRLIGEGWDVLVLDNLVTGVDSNVGHLLKHPNFRTRGATFLDTSTFLDRCTTFCNSPHRRVVWIT